MLALTAAALVAVAVSACGGARSGVPSRASRAVSAATGATPAPVAIRGDEDDDDEEGINYSPGTKPEGDSDNDTDNDYKDNAGKGYYDRDDGPVRHYGRAANAAETYVLKIEVERYYAAAASEDGVTACAMFEPIYAKSIPGDYGQPPGPSYLRGKTCAAVMSLLFKHDHQQLATPIGFVKARIRGNEALVTIRSPTIPASSVNLIRQHGEWWIVGALAAPFP